MLLRAMVLENMGSPRNSPKKRRDDRTSSRRDCEDGELSSQFDGLSTPQSPSRSQKKDISDMIFDLKKKIKFTELFDGSSN